MASGVDCLSPISPRSPMLIEHRPSHFNQSPIFALNNTVLLGDIRRGKLVLEAQRRAKGFKMSILEFCAFVIMNRSHGILRKLMLQPQNQISSMRKSLILTLHEKHPRGARKIIHDL